MKKYSNKFIDLCNKSKNLLVKLGSWKLPLFALIGFSFALISVLNRKADPIREPVINPPSTIFKNTVAGIGIVEPKSEVISLGTELAGIVRIVHVSVGDKVKQGSPLFTLDERDIDAQINILKAALDSSKVQLKDAAAQFELVKNIGDSRAVARDDFNQRKYAGELASTRIVEKEALLQQAIITKDRLKIKSPIDGEILFLNVRPGEFAAAGMLSEPLISIGDTSTLHLRVEVGQENANFVNPNSRAIGIKRMNTKTPTMLKFVRFEPFIRPKKNLASAGQRVDTRVLQIIYRLENAEKLPFVGEQMDVFIEREDGQ